MYLNSLDKSKCCGCTACEQVCTVKAISMLSDDEGFLYPVKNVELCTNCGLCEKVCPYENLNTTELDPEVYAAYIPDVAERTQSTSGGVFYVLAKYVIEKGGIVYGAVLNDDLKVVHKSAITLEELKPLRGSKYVQSNMMSVYHEVKNELRKERLVYFTGTPCQVAGLKAFLRKQYDNLITSDLVCHGVPSQKLFDTHLDYLKKKYKTDKIYNYQFRDYKTGGGCEIFNFANPKGQTKLVKAPTYELSPFLYSFMYAFTYRYSCYECPFAKVPRVGDITLADFWGVQKFYEDVDSSKGCSLVLLNTEQGEQLWKEISNQLYLKKSSLDKAAAFNGNLVHSSQMPLIRKTVYSEIMSKGYAYMAETKFRSPRYFRIKMSLCLRRIIGERGIKTIKTIIRRK